MNETNIPQIRFKGYTDTWEQRELGEFVAELRSGLSRMLSTEDIGLPVVRANNINDEKLDMTKEVKYWYVNDPQGANTENYFIKINDILINFINSEAKMGTGAIVDIEPSRDTIYTTNILKLRVNEKTTPKFFLATTLTHDYKEFIKGISKIAVNQASFTTVDFKKYNYLHPQIEEQTKIGEFFKTLDNLITCHQRKCDKLIDMKKSLLGKMFPTEGSDKPLVRFSGFTNTWEQRELGEISEFSKGKGYSKSDLTEMGIPIILYGRLYTKYETTISKVDTFVLNASSSIYSRGIEVVIPASGETPEDIARASAVEKSGIIIGGDLNIVYPNQKLNSTFLALTLSDGSARRILSRKAQGKSVVHLRNDDLRVVEILYPGVFEQTKIGEFFKTLDNLITCHQRELEKLQNTKKSLLEKMFV